VKTVHLTSKTLLVFFLPPFTTSDPQTASPSVHSPCFPSG